MGESCFSCHSLLLNHFALRCKLLQTKSLYEVSIELMMLTGNCLTFSIRQKIGLSWFKLFKWNWTLPCHLIANDTSSSTVQLTLDWTLFASLAQKPESNIGREVKTTLTPILDIQRCEPVKYFLTLENTLPFRLKVPMRKRRRNAVHHPAQRVSCTL